MNKMKFIILYYIIAFSLLIIAHKIDPTNLAGLGLDVFVYLLVFLVSILLFVKNIAATRNNKGLWIMMLIHFIAFAVLIGVLFVHPK
ncbi:MAG: hypothetical protein JWR12_1909 [Mucilaginibacter sp.]|nr:hypothetical protein [Mucilaginibacter sp.]